MRWKKPKNTPNPTQQHKKNNPPPPQNFSNANWGILLSTMEWVKISLANTTKNHLARITKKLNPILKIKFHILIHWFI
jgi:hypothetical protein